MNQYNRIVIIGNGFDRAAGLKTGYKDFIDHYIKNAVSQFFIEGEYDSEILNLKKRSINYTRKVDEYLKALDKKESANLAIKFIENVSNIKYKYDFLREIIETSHVNWVDLEQFYFDKLMSLFNQDILGYPLSRRIKKIKELNIFMDKLTSELHNYILEIDRKANISILNSPLFSLIEKCQEPLRNDISSLISRHSKQASPTSVVFLNFNYTNTVRSLTANKFIKPNIRHIHIHGNVNNSENPIVFGYGDDTNEEYNRLELEDNNDLIRKIKSFQYPRTKNYHHLLNILESKEFDVFILGHSCGLSDRTLLKTIFEHKNCLAIQNFHYKGESDDFNKRMQISRHFSNKTMMRERVLPFDPLATIPQQKVE